MVNNPRSPGWFCLLALLPLLLMNAACAERPLPPQQPSVAQAEKEELYIAGFATANSAILAMTVDGEPLLVQLEAAPYPEDSDVPRAREFVSDADDWDPFTVWPGDRALAFVRLSFRGKSFQWKVDDTILFHRVNFVSHVSIAAKLAQGSFWRFFGAAVGPDGAVAVSFSGGDGEGGYKGVIIMKEQELLGVHVHYPTGSSQMSKIAKEALKEFKPLPKPIQSQLDDVNTGELVQSPPQLPLHSDDVSTKLDSAVVSAGDVSVLIVQGPFDPRAHQIERDAQGIVVSIDGRTAYGTDGGLPGNELKAVTILFRGAAYDAPRSLWSDCYDVSLNGLQREAFRAKALPNNKGIVVAVTGSDGAGTFTVEWTWRLDGKPSTRRLKGAP